MLLKISKISGMRHIEKAIFQKSIFPVQNEAHSIQNLTLIQNILADLMPLSVIPTDKRLIIIAISFKLIQKSSVGLLTVPIFRIRPKNRHFSILDPDPPPELQNVGRADPGPSATLIITTNDKLSLNSNFHFRNRRKQGASQNFIWKKNSWKYLQN